MRAPTPRAAVTAGTRGSPGFLPFERRFRAFEVKEFASLDELRKEFETAGLGTLFPEFVLGLVK